MIRTDTLPRLLAACLLTIGLVRGAAADFTELEGLLEEPGASLSAVLEGDRVVVAVRNGGKQVGQWNIAQAVGLEVAAALGRHHLNVIRAAADSRFEKLETADRPFAKVQLKELKGTERQALVGIEWQHRGVSPLGLANGKPHAAGMSGASDGGAGRAAEARQAAGGNQLAGIGQSAARSPAGNLVL